MDGILVVAKPAGPTSHDVVALVRRLAATKRVGHGGTLDPFATGVLPIFLGKATRVVEYHLGDRKAYRATVCFGSTSSTDDLDGELTPVEGPAPTRDVVEAHLSTFRGPITQTPPAFSAIKVAGRRAYAMARAGQPVELAPRAVEIFRLVITSWDESDPERPIAVIEVECSAGTYVRALARDLGAAVGSGAYLGALTRTASGGFRLENATALDDVRAAAADGVERLGELLLPVDAGLESLPVVEIPEGDIAAIARGQIIRPPVALPDDADARYRLKAPDGSLVAISAVRAGRLAPDKVFVEPPGPGTSAAAPGAATNAGRDVAAADAAELDPSTAADPDFASPDDL
ncbi:MAG TPA: tRNA pseudouridine(55) synthase TruB [Candidatus Limnocylindrales bacterium]